MKRTRFPNLLVATVLATAAFGLLTPGEAWARIPDVRKIALVDLQRLLSETKAGKNAQSSLQSSSNAKQGKLAKKQKELEQKAQKLQGLSGQDLASAQQRLQREYMELQQMLFTLQQDLAKQETQLLEQFYRNSRKIVAKMADEDQLDLVLIRDQGTVMHTQESYDITDEVIRRYDKSHPK